MIRRDEWERLAAEYRQVARSTGLDAAEMVRRGWVLPARSNAIVAAHCARAARELESRQDTAPPVLPVTCS